MERITRFGGLDCVVWQAGQGQPDLCVVLNHGFGAPGTDLVGLAPELSTRMPSQGAQVRFVFPAAPTSLAPIGYGEGRAWWMIDFERLQRAQLGDLSLTRKMRGETPADLPKVRKLLRAALDQMSAQFGLPLSRFVLGGFSQGAMLATDLALRLEEAPAGLLILSGTLLSEPEWTKLAKGRAGLPVFQSHGREDPILPFDAAEALRDLLAGAGLAVEFLPFRGGHTIPLEGVERAAAFIEERAKKG